MRLICTITSEHPDENPFAFSQMLSNRGIENSCEEVILPEGTTFYRIWVTDEEKMGAAQRAYQEYQQNPGRHPFTEPPAPNDIEHLPPPETRVKKAPPPRRPSFLSPAPYGRVTIFILLLCGLLYLGGEMGRSDLPPKIPGVVELPLFSSIYKPLLFDYPHYFTLRDELIQSPDNKALLDEIKKSSFWQGLYPLVVNHLKAREPLAYSGPTFEKIKEGEIWRLFTPAILHFNFLHIFFNILWFILLGNQIEYRIGSIRYLLLILITAVIANIAQYLMSGPIFLGISGVVVGLAGFIWARQQKAPWEGYLLNRATLIFLGAFVFGMCALQILFFIIEISSSHQGIMPIANTAHIVGGIVGYLLGRLSLFRLQKKS